MRLNWVILKDTILYIVLCSKSLKAKIPQNNNTERSNSCKAKIKKIAISIEKQINKIVRIWIVIWPFKIVVFKSFAFKDSDLLRFQHFRLCLLKLWCESITTIILTKRLFTSNKIIQNLFAYNLLALKKITIDLK